MAAQQLWKAAIVTCFCVGELHRHVLSAQTGSKHHGLSCIRASLQPPALAHASSELVYRMAQVVWPNRSLQPKEARSRHTLTVKLSHCVLCIPSVLKINECEARGPAWCMWEASSSTDELQKRYHLLVTRADNEDDNEDGCDST